MDTAYESFAEIDQLDPEYLLPGSAFLIPRGDLTLLYGTGGVGKGRLLMSVIADVVNDGGSVIVILPEATFTITRNSFTPSRRRDFAACCGRRKCAKRRTRAS